MAFNAVILLQLVLWSKQATLKEQSFQFLSLQLTKHLHYYQYQYILYYNCIFTFIENLIDVNFVNDFYYSNKCYLQYIYFIVYERIPMKSIFEFLKKMSRYSMVTDSESYNGFPQINHRPLVIMDGCGKRCEINTISLT